MKLASASRSAALDRTNGQIRNQMIGVRAPVTVVRPAISTRMPAETTEQLCGGIGGAVNPGGNDDEQADRDVRTPSAIHSMTRMRRLSSEIVPNEAAAARVGARCAIPHAIRIADAVYTSTAAVDTTLFSNRCA
jgi:hypothetical protein